MLIDIRSIKIYIISPCVDKYKKRLLTVFSRLLDYGFQDIVFFKSVQGNNGTHSLTNSVIEIMKLELDNDTPFIILEDDCELFNKYDKIEIPDNCDVFYLGVSQWIYPYSVDTLFTRARPHIYHNSLNPHTSYNEDIVQVKGMTSGHAIMFISREYIKHFLRDITNIIQHVDDLPHDLLYAILQYSYNVFSLKKPMFYQDATLDGQEIVTKLLFTNGAYQ